MKKAASLLGGWDTTEEYDKVKETMGVYDKGIYRNRRWALARVLRDIQRETGFTSEVHEPQLDRIVEMIYLYDNAIAKRRRANLPFLKAMGMRECAKLLNEDLATSYGLTRAGKLWDYIRKKIHRGPVIPPYPLDAPDQKVRLNDPAVPWIGTYYSYPRVNTSAAVEEYLKDNPDVPDYDDIPDLDLDPSAYLDPDYQRGALEGPPDEEEEEAEGYY